MVEQITVNDEVGGSSPSSTATLPEANISGPPELTISQDGHRIFAVMGFTNDKNIRTVAIERLPRQFLKMDEEQQKWFLNSQGIAEKLLIKLGLKKSMRAKPRVIKGSGRRSIAKTVVV